MTEGQVLALSVGLLAGLVTLILGLAAISFAKYRRKANLLSLVEGSTGESGKVSKVRRFQFRLTVQKLVARLPADYVSKRSGALLRAGFFQREAVFVVLVAEVAWVLMAMAVTLSGPIGVRTLVGALLLGCTPIVSGAVLGFVARRRSESLTLQLPAVVDLMALTVGAGLGLLGSLERVVQTQSGQLAEELARTLDDLQLGISRLDAFEALSRRTDSVEVKRFADAIAKVDLLGISLTTVLREQSRELKHKRRTKARERAQQVSVKILVPLVFCFLPGLFIVVLGPGIIRLVESLGL